jgi:hypothetical protein
VSKTKATDHRLLIEYSRAGRCVAGGRLFGAPDEACSASLRSGDVESWLYAKDADREDAQGLIA